MTEDELMLTSILDCDREDLVLRRKQLSQEQKTIYRKMKERRDQGEPLQYILGSCNFMGLDLDVDNRALIPRPETEIMVELAINKVKCNYFGKEIRILDLGSGSGNISICFAKNLDNCHATAVDLSKEALQLAENNAKKNLVFDKIDFIHKDMIEFLSLDNKYEFDVIISNPPYISTSDLNGLPADVKQEPVIALDGGMDGLDYYRQIIPLSEKLLSKNGFLICEIGDEQTEGILQIFSRSEGYKDVSFSKDYVGTDRIVIAEKE